MQGLEQKNKNFLQRILSTSYGAYVLIFIAIFVVFVPSLSYQTVNLDDENLVLKHYEFNKDLASISQSFLENVFRDQEHLYYRPMLRISFIMDAQFGKENVIFISHLTNILLHIGAMCLLFCLLLKLKIRKDIAFLFTLFFSIHPLTTQAVSWIAGRNDTLLAVFVLPSIFFFIDFIERNKIKYFITHLVFLILALLTKETALVIPPILGLYVFIFKGLPQVRQNYKKYLLVLLSWVGILSVCFITRNMVLGGLNNAMHHSTLFSIYQNSPSLIPAIGKIFMPFDLSVLPILQDMSMVYGSFVIVFLTIYYILSERKNYKMILFGVLWFLLFVVISLVKSTNIIPDFAEHRIYIPMFGFIFILLGLGSIAHIKTTIEKYIPKRHEQEEIFFAIFFVAIIFLARLTVIRNENYKNSLNFWTNAVETSPNNAFGYSGLGIVYYLSGDYQKAEGLYKRALEINPKEKSVHNNLGVLYQKIGKTKEAEEEFKKEEVIKTLLKK